MYIHTLSTLFIQLGGGGRRESKRNVLFDTYPQHHPHTPPSSIRREGGGESKRNVAAHPLAYILIYPTDPTSPSPSHSTNFPTRLTGLHLKPYSLTHSHPQNTPRAPPATPLPHPFMCPTLFLRDHIFLWNVAGIPALNAMHIFETCTRCTKTIEPSCTHLSTCMYMQFKTQPNFSSFYGKFWLRFWIHTIFIKEYSLLHHFSALALLLH